MLKRILLGSAAVLAVVIVAGVTLVELRWKRTFDAPLPDLRASGDPAVIARGRYLVYGPAHCAYCHNTAEAGAALDRGEQPPLAGGMVFKLPVGTFRTPNLTPDSGSGIGAVSDGQIARMVRYGVRPDSRAGLPFMNFRDMSDSDLVAVLSFLRSQPAIARVVQPHEFNFIGKAVMAFVIKPIGPKGVPPQESPEGVTVERGAYLVGAVAECADCHTQRSMVSGAYIGPRLAGGTALGSDSGGLEFVPPNLTPEPRTGRIASWTEDQFVARFRRGRLLPGTPMPWNAFARMSDDDLRSIYRYLRTLPPVVHETGPAMRHKN